MEKKESLLQDITSQEVDILIDEEKLKSEGYKFYYFIDTHEINKYAFPFGLVENANFDNREGRSLEIITDEQITYYYLINKVANEKKSLLLFDEHRAELNDFINSIRRIKNIGLEIVDSFKKQADLFNKRTISVDEWEKNKKLFSSELNVSYLISIALGSLYNGEQRLKYIIENKLNYDDPEGLPPGVDEDLFCQSKPGDITKIIFDRLCVTQNKEINDNLRLLNARYKKCMIYNRLININNNAITKNNKNLFVLVSSAKTTNKTLPQIVNDYGFTIPVNGINFIPVRSVKQIYLQLLLQDNGDKIKELMQIKSFISLKETIKDKEIEEKVDVQLFQYKYLSDFRESYENISLLLNEYYHENVFKKALSGGSVKNYKEIENTINELLKIAKKTKVLEKLKLSSLNSIEINIAQFLHTEALLNLQEFYEFKNPEHLSTAQKTIQEAIGRTGDISVKEKYEKLKKEIENATNCKTFITK